MINDLVAIFIALVVAAIGIAGIFLPILPSVPLVWLALFLYAYLTAFEALSLTTVLVFLGLTILTIILDFVAPLVGAKAYKATKYGITGSVLGLLLGMFIFGPIGIILGPLAGAFIGETVFSKKDSTQAFKASLGTLMGFLAGALIKLIIILVMLGFFIASLF